MRVSEYIRCKLIRIWCATPEKVIRTSYRVRVVCVITKDDRNTFSHPHMYVCVIISNNKTGMYLRSRRCFIRQIGEKWGCVDLACFFFSDKRRNQTAAVIAPSPPVRIMPIIDLPPLEPFPLSGLVWPCSNDVPGYFHRVPLNSVATEPHKAPSVSTGRVSSIRWTFIARFVFALGNNSQAHKPYCIDDS